MRHVIKDFVSAEDIKYNYFKTLEKNFFKQPSSETFYV